MRLSIAVALLLMISGCGFMKPLGWATLPGDLAAACEEAYPLAPGDSWEVAAIENKARLLDCRERHQHTVRAVTGG